VKLCFGDVCRTPKVLSARQQLCSECRAEARRVYQRERWRRKYQEPEWKARKRALRLAAYHRKKDVTNANRRMKSKLRYWHDEEYRAKKTASVRDSYEAHKEKRLAAHKVWLEKNRDHMKAYWREYRKKRRARKMEEAA
jgi:hypothetical protein